MFRYNLSCPLLILVSLLLFTSGVSAQTDKFSVSTYEADAQRIINAALEDDEAFETLTYFADTFGHRLSGSKSLERSIDWIVEKMKKHEKRPSKSSYDSKTPGASRA